VQKKRANIPNVATKCNNFVTICNKHELNVHNNVKESTPIVANLGGYYDFWE
jgi:hypothetical protein